MTNNEKNIEKRAYVAPSIKIVTFQVERGFAASADPQSVHNLNEFVQFEESNNSSSFERYTEKTYTW